jgi:hypothetical protein
LFFLKFVDVKVESGDFEFQTLPLSRSEDDLRGLAVGFQRITLEDLPMVEDALREGLARCVGAEIGSETERFIDGQVSFDVLEGTRTTIFFGNDLATTSVENAIDTTDDGSGALDFDQIDGFHDSGFGGEFAGIEAAASSGDDLSSSSVDGVSMESDVEHFEGTAAHVLFAEDAFLGGPLEGGDARVLDFIEILDGFSGIKEDVGSGGVGAKAPNLSGLIWIPFVFVSKNLGAELGVVLGSDGSVIDFGGEFFLHANSAHEETVVLVGGFGETGLRRLSSDGFSVGDNGIGGTDFNSRKFFSEILEANFEMEFSGTSDNVLARFFSVALDARIRFGETF